MSVKDQCSKFVLSGQPLGPGHTGYITECSADCMTGYTQIDRCGGSNKACSTVCGDTIDPNGCGLGSGPGRAICARNYTSYPPSASTALLNSKCCIYNEKDPALIANDCPPNVWASSPGCGGVIAEACLTDINTVIRPGCEALAKSDVEARKNSYNILMTERCTKTNIDNLNDTPCLTWCINNPQYCSKSVILDYCKDKMNEEKYNGLCGCFYPESVYAGVRDKLSKEFSVPSDLFAGGRQCYFPLCANAAIEYSSTAPCKDLNLVSCVNNVDIKNDGTIGSVTVAQTSECKNFSNGGDSKCDDINCNGYLCNPTTDTCYTTCTTNAQCGTSYECKNGRCEVPANACNPATCGAYKCNSLGTACATTCSTNNDCTGTNTCNSGKCTQLSWFTKNRTILIAVGVIVSLIILGLFIYFIVRSRRKSNNDSIDQGFYDESNPPDEL